jgi:SAM-dependent methyltransferase
MREINNIITDGLVGIGAYDQLIKSAGFEEIESFSNNFINEAGPLVVSFDNRWIADPLHQWSRRWEYPYIIKNAALLDSNATIIDLGAGMSFLTFFLEKKLNLKNITAVDYDKTLSELYEKVNEKIDANVKFQYGDMRNLLDLSSNSADFIYSVSALEHTNNYTEILKEIYRILKKGGKLSFTFDISIDGLDDIPVAKAEELVSALEEVFNTKVGIDIRTSINSNVGELVTSGYIASIDKRLMPWKYPLVNVLKPIAKRGKIGNLYKNLTFCCLTVVK